MQIITNLDEIAKRRKLTNFIKVILVAYLLILFIAAIFIVPTTDTFHYLSWSKHLQLSYFDGPPLIAYVIYLTTHLFGNNYFALNVIATLSIVLSAWLSYKIVILINDDKFAAQCVALLFMLYPFATTRFMALSMTLDCLEVPASLLIIYFSLCLIKYQQISYIYLLGVSCGIGLLAKYNVVIVIAALLSYFALRNDLRKVYVQIHLYLAMIISLVIFAPVLIWNYQHHWTSFIYQLSSHAWVGSVNAINAKSKHGIFGIWFYLASCVFGVLNLWLVLLGYLKFIKQVSFAIKDNVYNALLAFIITFILIFWLIVAYFAHVGLNYMLAVSSLLTIIVGTKLADIKAYMLIKWLSVLLLVVSIVMLISKC